MVSTTNIDSEYWLHFDAANRENLLFVPHHWVALSQTKGIAHKLLLLALIVDRVWVKSNTGDVIGLNHKLAHEEVWLSVGLARRWAKTLGISPRQVKDWVNALIETEMLVLVKASPEEIKHFLIRSKTPQSVSIEGTDSCSWCAAHTFVLHSHHFPVPKDKGGTETVSICPNCHFEYHALEDAMCLSFPEKLFYIE